MSWSHYLIYFTVAFFYIISPGPAVVLAILNGVRAHMQRVVYASLGNIIGLFILSTLAILGLGTLMRTSAILFLAVKSIGALYLIYLGFKYLTSKNSLDFDVEAPDDGDKSNTDYFKESFWVAVTNPKPILFFTAIFPQFLEVTKPIAPQFFIMTFTFMAISFSSLTTYAFIAQKSKRFLGNSNNMLWFHRVTGGIFITLGLGMLMLKSRD